jgi:hypothetical protein
VTPAFVLNVKGLLMWLLRGGSGCVLCNVFDLCHTGTGCPICIGPDDDLCRVWRSRYTSGMTITLHIVVSGMRDVCPESPDSPYGLDSPQPDQHP